MIVDTSVLDREAAEADGYSAACGMWEWACHMIIYSLWLLVQLTEKGNLEALDWM